MALKITALRIDPVSLGEIFLLADITPSYEYKDGERTDKLDGYRYSVVLPAHKMEKLSIKVSNKIPLVDIENSGEIPIGTAVKFSNLEVGSYYEEITVRGQDYILVHAGLENFKKTKRLIDYQLHEIIWAETNYDKVYFEDKILITGHTPVQLLSNGRNNKILKMNNHIAIDCGCGFHGKLGVLCLDTMEEMYF